MSARPFLVATQPGRVRMLVGLIGALSLSAVGLYMAALAIAGRSDSPDPTLVDIANLINLATVAACVALAFAMTHASPAVRDARLVRSAFALILVADLIFVAAHGSSGSWRSSAYAVAISLFAIVQVLLIARHLQGFEPSELRRKANTGLTVVLLALSAPILLSLRHVSTPPPDTAPPFGVIAAYTVFLGTSLWASVGARWRGVLDSRQAAFAAWGLLLFAACDICVAFQLLTNPASHPELAALPEIARLLVWVFYPPALTLLALSASRGDSAPART